MKMEQSHNIPLTVEFKRRRCDVIMQAGPPQRLSIDSTFSILNKALLQPLFQRLVNCNMWYTPVEQRFAYKYVSCPRLYNVHVRQYPNLMHVSALLLNMYIPFSPRGLWVNTWCILFHLSDVNRLNDVFRLYGKYSTPVSITSSSGHFL